MVAFLLLDHTGIISPVSLSPIPTTEVGEKAARIFYQFVWQSINLPLHLHGEIGSYASIKLHTFKSHSCFHIPWYYLRFNLCGEIVKSADFSWCLVGWKFHTILRRRDGSNCISTTGFIKTACFLSACGRNMAKGAVFGMLGSKNRGGWKWMYPGIYYVCLVVYSLSWECYRLKNSRCCIFEILHVKKHTARASALAWYAWFVKVTQNPSKCDLLVVWDVLDHTRYIDGWDWKIARPQMLVKKLKIMNSIHAFSRFAASSSHWHQNMQSFDIWIMSQRE